MPSLNLVNDSLTLTYSAESWASSPESSYTAWAAALGVSDTATLVGPLADDDNAWAVELAAPFFSGGSTTAMFSSEAGIGLYRTTPSNQNAYGYSIANVARMFGLVSRPTLLLTFHPNGSDLQNFGFKLQRSGSTTILYSAYSNFGDTGLERAQAAIKLGPGSLELVLHASDVDTAIRLVELQEWTSGYTIQQVAAQTAAAGTTCRLMASLASVSDEGYVSVDGPLGLPAMTALAPAAGPLSARSPLGAGSGEQAMALAWQEVNGLMAGPPIGQVSAMVGVHGAGLLSAASPLAPLAGRAYSDFGAQLVPSPNRYVMDIVVAGVALRVPISTWQATQQLERSCYVQCSVPACAPWVEQIQSATEFVISRVGRAADGSTVEVEMARAPLESHALDHGPTNFTATLSGYTQGFAAPDGAPGALGSRVLAGVRSLSFGAGGTGAGWVRVRAAIDWLLRPGDWVRAGGREFQADYINYYVPATGDAYMDVGERA